MKLKEVEFIFTFYITKKIDKSHFLSSVGKKINEQEYEIDKNSPMLKLYFEKIQRNSLFEMSLMMLFEEEIASNLANIRENESKLLNMKYSIL